MRYVWEDGLLRADGRAYPRPCDWATACGPEAFLGGPRAWTPAARDALARAAAASITPLRGLPDDFLIFAAGLQDATPAVCGLAVAPTTLTVRFEDVWRLLPPAARAFAYACDAARDPHAGDAPAAQVAGIVRETLPGLAPDVRICLDLAANGGFTLAFRPAP